MCLNVAEWERIDANSVIVDWIRNGVPIEFISEPEPRIFSNPSFSYIIPDVCCVCFVLQKQYMVSAGDGACNVGFLKQLLTWYLYRGYARRAIQTSIFQVFHRRMFPVIKGGSRRMFFLGGGQMMLGDYQMVFLEEPNCQKKAILFPIHSMLKRSILEGSHLSEPLGATMSPLPPPPPPPLDPPMTVIGC